MSDELEPDAPAATPAPHRRPGGITFVVILTWIAAIVDLVGGIVLLLLSFDTSLFTDTEVSPTLVRYYGLIALVLGLLTVLVALGLGKGSQFSRVFTILVMAVRLLNAAWALIAIRYVTLWPAVFDLAIAIIIIALLTNRSASDYFRKRT